MANENSIGVVEEAYNNFKRGDVGALLAQMDASIEWHVPDVPSARFGGRRQGQERVREFFTILGTDQDVVTFEPRQFFAQGDTVVALGNYEWRVKATGKSFRSDFAHVFTVRDGKVTRFQEYTDSAAASEAYRK
jgi:uncharacterized protein